MPGNYINEAEKMIYPKWGFMVEAMDWARQFPESYQVYSAGMIEYATDKDLTMFLVRWSE